MGNKIKKHHYICKDSAGGLFMTTERCSSIEDARQYVGDNEILYPFIEDVYTQALEPRMIPTTGGGFVEPFFSTQSAKDI